MTRDPMKLMKFTERAYLVFTLVVWAACLCVLLGCLFDLLVTVPFFGVSS